MRAVPKYEWKYLMDTWSVDENGSLILAAGSIFHGDLHLGQTNLVSLPDGLVVKGSLDVSQTRIARLPSRLTVQKTLNLMNTRIAHLPEGLSVGGDLILLKTQIEALPKGLKVGGVLWLSGTQIIIPDDFVYSDGRRYSDYRDIDVPALIKDHGEMIIYFIENEFNGLKFDAVDTFVDRLYANNLPHLTKPVLYNMIRSTRKD